MTDLRSGLKEVIIKIVREWLYIQDNGVIGFKATNKSETLTEEKLWQYIQEISINITDSILSFLEKVVDEEKIEEVLGKIEIPIDQSPFEVEETKHPAILKLRNQYAKKIAHAIKQHILGKEKLDGKEKY